MPLAARQERGDDPREVLYEVRRQALLAHATQIDPSSPFWFGLPPEIAREVHPYDDYVLARSLVDTPTPEDDLFAGVRERVSR